MKKVILFLIFITLVVAACKKDIVDDTPQYQPFLPSNFPTPTYDLTTNPVTKEGFELGRSLFYDPILSLDSTISCGNCHQQTAGFTQHGHDISHGIKDRLGIRNAQPVMNMLWNKSFFWDGGVHNLDFVAISALTSPVEMEETLDGVVAKLKRHKTYPTRFKTVFNSEEITSAKMLKAVSQFMVMCVSGNSKYDKFVRNEGAILTTDEQAGLNIVKTKCGNCHNTDLFTDHSFRNNGLEETSDKGRYTASLIESDKNKFRVPTLRNLTYTAPFMHDGRFQTLDQVLKHYTEGVRNSATLDPVLNQNGKLGIILTEQEKTQIKAFLKTLEEEAFIRDKRFSEQ
ncbi:MAG: cytochrome-c peroxidase [Saprospiraceae bacterium]|nr:cytochrome-c peroxidase [Saprospiraceae bacterium]